MNAWWQWVLLSLWAVAGTWLVIVRPQWLVDLWNRIARVLTR